VQDLGDIDIHLRDEIEHFFEYYKTIEPGKLTETRGWEGAVQAEVAIVAAKEAARA
jgi:inorganic pyrophosphatase